MNFSEEQLEEVESMASLFYSVDDIMIAIEIDFTNEEEFKDILLLESSQIGRAHV